MFMIWCIIIMLLRRRVKRFLKTLHLQQIVAVLLALLSTVFVISACGQQTNLTYNIKHGGSVIGKLCVTQKRNDSVVNVALCSKVKAGFIITFSVNDVEESMFNNGVLYHSKIYREVNGVEKVSKEHLATNSGYIIARKNKKNVVMQGPIKYNLMLMYTVEPLQTNLVYSDNYEQYLTLQKIGEHCYKLLLPDDNFQNYYYKNGVCFKIEMHSTFFTATMQLVSNTTL